MFFVSCIFKNFQHIFCYFPLYPLQSAHTETPPPNKKNTSVISYNFYLFELPFTFAWITLQGSQNPRVSIIRAITVMSRLIYLLKCIIFMAPSSHMQKTHQSALQVQQKAETLLQANHYDMDMIRDCAEKVFLSRNFKNSWIIISLSRSWKVAVLNQHCICVCVKVADHWQQLMLKMEDRLKLVNASVAFYKTSEQVLF